MTASPGELRALLAKAMGLLDQSESRCNVPHQHHAGRRVVGFKIEDSDGSSFLTGALDQLEAVENIVRAVPSLLDRIAELEGALEVGKRFLDKCNSAWAAGEPSHRVRDMLDAADTFRAALNALP